MISIHPPLAGWDLAFLNNGYNVKDFNPPTPCGVGHQNHTCTTTEPDISIHPPLAGWDIGPRIVCNAVDISIHPPLAGWDLFGETMRRAT